MQSSKANKHPTPYGILLCCDSDSTKIDQQRKIINKSTFLSHYSTWKQEYGGSLLAEYSHYNFPDCDTHISLLSMITNSIHYTQQSRKRHGVFNEKTSAPRRIVDHDDGLSPTFFVRTHWKVSKQFEEEDNMVSHSSPSVRNMASLSRRRSRCQRLGLVESSCLALFIDVASARSTVSIISVTSTITFYQRIFPWRLRLVRFCPLWCNFIPPPNPSALLFFRTSGIHGLRVFSSWQFRESGRSLPSRKGAKRVTEPLKYC